MKERWQLMVELTLDIQENENPDQALERARKGLNKVQGTGKEFAHYHIMQPPKQVVELD